MVETVKKEEVDMENFDWVALQKELRTSSTTGLTYEETNTEKLWRKMGENPLIPIGATATTAVLCVGIFSFATKRSKLSQVMMRARVVAQGFTIACMVGTILHQASQGKPRR